MRRYLSADGDVTVDDDDVTVDGGDVTVDNDDVNVMWQPASACPRTPRPWLKAVLASLGCRWIFRE